MTNKKRNSIPVRQSTSKDLFVSWEDETGKVKALNQFKDAEITAGSYSGYSFRDIDTNTSVRQEFNREDYEYFRPGEAIPKTQVGRIAASMQAYKDTGLIHNVIDLMSDFACQGIHLVHNSPNVQQFYREWFEKVNGDERSERFVNKLLRCGNLIVKFSTAKLNSKQAEKLRKGLAADIEIQPEDLQLEKREIPWKYIFLNPLSLEVVGGELSPFIGRPLFNLKLPTSLRRRVNNNTDAQIAKLLNALPPDILNAIKAGKKSIPLDPSKTKSFYYKKDDWDVWAEPMVGPILKDIIMLEKLKLADMSALDGAINRIRLWKLGSMENKIAATDAAYSKLATELTNNVGAGSIDLIWNDAIELFESSSDVHKFLGDAKYQPCLTAIYQGLGIPPTLTGTATASGFTNNYISLKTLVERLNYVRGILLDFWNEQIKLVQKAMGFRFPATVVFDRMTLSDEAAEKALLVQLADRDLISVETIQERFGEIPELEKARMNKEKRTRDKGMLAHKAGPWHNPQQEFDMKKTVLQGGGVAPSEVGLNLHPKKKGEKSALQMQAQMRSKKTGIPQQGRPVNSKDKQKRKQKRVKVRTSAFLWAKEAQDVIADVITPAFLKICGKKNQRMLTDTQVTQLENYKFNMLLSLKPFQEVSTELIQSIACDKPPVLQEPMLMYNQFLQAWVAKTKKQPNIEQIRDMRALVYVSYKGAQHG